MQRNWTWQIGAGAFPYLDFQPGWAQYSLVPGAYQAFILATTYGNLETAYSNGPLSKRTGCGLYVSRTLGGIYYPNFWGTDSGPGSIGVGVYISEQDVLQPAPLMDPLNFEDAVSRRWRYLRVIKAGNLWATASVNPTMPFSACFRFPDWNLVLREGQSLICVVSNTQQFQADCFCRTRVSLVRP